MKIKKLVRTVFKPLELITPLKVAFTTLFLCAVVVFFTFEVHLFRNRSFTDILLVLAVSFGAILGGAFVATHLFDSIKKLPSAIIFYGGSAIAMFTLLFTSSRTPNGNYVAIGATVVFLFTLTYEIYSKYAFLRRKEKIIKSKWHLFLHYLCLVLSFMLMVYIFFTDGVEDKLYENAFESYVAHATLTESPPIYEVIKGVYGNEAYLNKYPSEVQVESETSSASYFINSWNDTREKHLGFNIYSIPLNAQFYMPKEKGSYPLVVLVHGNHEMTHDSEIGYDYLGTYLAERGYIVASVDENFLNYSTFESELMDAHIGNENDARAYILLSHIKYLEKQNRVENSAFYQQIDMENIALMGHSRGGEAVAVADFFNEVNYLPSDFRKQLGRDFNIKSIVAIAPTDKQYKPASRPIELDDVNYLLLHGSHDMDVSYMAGGNQYERTTFTGGDFFKTQVWIYGANHGYFNEEWHIADTAFIAGKLHNTGQLISRLQQEDTASQLIYYFLEATLRGKKDYEAGFKNLKVFEDLPENLYLTQYHHSKDQVIVDYTEDNYLETGTMDGVNIKSSGLSKWYEGTSRLDGRTSMVYGAYIGWEGYLTSEYIIDVTQTDLELSLEDAVYLTLADDTKKSQRNYDMTIELIDGEKNKAILPLSYYGEVQHSIEINLGKFYMIEDIKNRESFFQSFELPLSEFVSESEDFDLSNVEKIILSFPKGEPRVVFLKDLGIRPVD